MKTRKRNNLGARNALKFIRPIFQRSHYNQTTKKLIVLSLAPKKLRVAEFPGNFGSLSIQKDIYYLYNLEIKDILLS